MAGSTPKYHFFTNHSERWCFEVNQLGMPFPFEPIRPLGSGTAASVWLMEHTPTGRRLAIKILKAADDTLAQRDDRLREVRLVARSRHPNILRVYGTGYVAHDVYAEGEIIMEQGQQYLVTEFASGGPLQVSPESLDWENLSYILRAFFQGLARVHARGIVHLDLKPANILKCGGRIVVADFGIARWSHMNPEDESVHGLTGTPNYMAPEQISCRTNLYGP